MALRDYLNTDGVYRLWNDIKPKIDAKFGKVKVGAGELTPTASDDSIEVIGSNPVTVTANTLDNSLTIAHSDSGATAGSYGDSSAQTPDFGDTFKVPTVTVDAKGHVTSASEHTVTIPAETSSIGSVSVDGTTISSSSAGDTISLTSGANITLTPDAVNKTINIASASSVKSGTTSYWDTYGHVISTKDVLYVYTDWKKNSDNEDIAGIKVGDGLAYIVDLPFTDQLWAEHVLDSLIHVSAADRTNWDNKVTCYIDPTNSENVVFSKYNLPPTPTVDVDVTGSIVSFTTDYALPIKKGEFTVKSYQAGTGDPSPTNIRNIVPRRAVNIYQRGINLWDEQWESGGYNNSTGEKSSSSGRIRSKNAIPVAPSKTYYVKYYHTPLVVLKYDKHDNFISGVISFNDPGTFTTDSATCYIRFYLVADTYENNISINYPSTDTSYHAYNGNDYLINLGEDTYGAVINTVDGGKKKTYIVNKIADMNIAYYAPSASYPYGFFILRGTPTKKSGVTNFMSSCFNVRNGAYWSTLNSTFGNGANDYIYVVSDKTSTEEFINAFGDEEMCYELETPIDGTSITPTTITTFEGNNTIFCDTGDSDVIYTKSATT